MRVLTKVPALFSWVCFHDRSSLSFAEEARSLKANMPHLGLLYNRTCAAPLQAGFQTPPAGCNMFVIMEKCVSPIQFRHISLGNVRECHH